MIPQIMEATKGFSRCKLDEREAEVVLGDVRKGGLMLQSLQVRRA